MSRGPTISNKHGDTRGIATWKATRTAQHWKSFDIWWPTPNSTTIEYDPSQSSQLHHHRTASPKNLTILLHQQIQHPKHSIIEQTHSRNDNNHSTTNRGTDQTANQNALSCGFRHLPTVTTCKVSHTELNLSTSAKHMTWYYNNHFNQSIVYLHVATAGLTAILIMVRLRPDVKED